MMILIGAAGLVGAAGAILCVLAWHRGVRVPPALAVATVALPAIVALLAAEMALGAAATEAARPALVVIAPHVVAALVGRELAFFAALVPGMCLIGGSCLLALRRGDLRTRTWVWMALALLPVVALPMVHALLHHQLSFGAMRSAAYLVLAVTGAGALAGRAADEGSQVASAIAFAIVVAVGEAAALSVSYMMLLQDLGQMGAVSRGDLDLAVQEITGGLVWLTVAAGWAGVGAIGAVLLSAGTQRLRAMAALLWLAPVPLAFLAGDITELLLTVV